MDSDGNEMRTFSSSNTDCNNEKVKGESCLKEQTTHKIQITKTVAIHIIKPLIILKICFFLLLGSLFRQQFVTLLYKQRGITASELSTMYIVTPVSQLLLTLVSGVLIDKVGKAKHIYAAINGLVIICLITMLALPSAKRSESCKNRQLHMHCLFENFNKLNEIQKNLTTLHRNFGDLNFINDSAASTSSNISDLFLEICNTNFTDDSVLRNKTWCGNHCNESCNCNMCKDAARFSKILVAVYGITFVVFLTFFTVSYRLMDVFAMCMVEQYGSDYGFHRFFGFCGNLILSPIAGLLVDASTPQGSSMNYSVALYFSIGLTILLVICVYKLEITIVRSKGKLNKSDLSLLKKPDVIVFIFVLLILGTSWNFDTSYTVWYLESFKPPSVLLGLQGSIVSLYALPFFLGAKIIIGNVGTLTILLLAHFAYVIHFLAFSYLTNPWFSLVISSTSIVWYTLLWVTVIEYSFRLAPEGMTSSFVAMAGGIHFSATKSLMGLTGGQVLSHYGERVAYRFMAAVCGVGGTLFATYYGLRHLMLKKTEQTNKC